VRKKVPGLFILICPVRNSLARQGQINLAPVFQIRKVDTQLLVLLSLANKADQNT